MSGEKILLVDDEQDIVELLEYNLLKEGYQVRTASNGKEALKIATSYKPDLVILDVMMPVMDGMQTCEALRKGPNHNGVIIAMLTARGEDYSQIAGFDAGADDYITKPVKPKVLVSRVKALLRRGTTEIDIPEENVSIVINRDKYLVIKDGNEFNLPKKEFELLNLLYSKPGSVFTRQNILSSVWGDEVVVGDRTIDVHIRKLREKLGSEHFVTIKGVGYKFQH
ncbi:MAG: response regulator transcription factor [Flavobacteriales bacterium]|jgi:two-component system alkaline phosphatase synthesis response regulator PhoP|tara:strand:- start:7550 stop:8221 length:672 start_codon:yes stop_codon:yes gene_type:complete